MSRAVPIMIGTVETRVVRLRRATRTIGQTEIARALDITQVEVERCLVSVLLNLHDGLYGPG